MTKPSAEQLDTIRDTFSHDAVAVDSRSLCGGAQGYSEIEHELVFSLLLWETTLDQAVRAMSKLTDTFIDTNELRVCLPSDIAAVLGARYAQCERRCETIVGTLQELNTLHPGGGIHELTEMNKRDLKKELHSMESLPRFAASRLLLLALDAHAFPMDTKLARELHKAGYLDDHSDPDTLAAAIELHIPSADTPRVYTAMERWLSGELDAAHANGAPGGPVS